ncbi:hypothetical protein D3C72_2570600 [compost metagenome]
MKNFFAIPKPSTSAAMKTTAPKTTVSKLKKIARPLKILRSSESFVSPIKYADAKNEKIAITNRPKAKG